MRGGCGDFVTTEIVSRQVREGKGASKNSLDSVCLQCVRGIQAAAALLHPLRLALDSNKSISKVKTPNPMENKYNLHFRAENTDLNGAHDNDA